jgi:hypothetical protein
MLPHSTTAPEFRLADDLYLPLELATETVGILAKRRVGKSYTAARLVEQALHANLQVLIVDPKGDWWGLRSSHDGAHPGFPILILGGDHGDLDVHVRSGQALAEFVVEQGISALLDLSWFRKRELATFVTDFLETLYRLKAHEQYRTPLLLVIDEADAVAPQRPQRGEERMLGAAEDLVRRGGQRGVGTVLITQRAAVVNKNVLTQLGVLIMLRTISPQDLSALDDWIRVHGTPEQRDVLMASLPSLPIGTAWVWAPGWPAPEGIFQQVRVARRETYDSGATPKVGQTVRPPDTTADVDPGRLRDLLAATIDEPAPAGAVHRTRSAASARVERVEVPVITDAQLERVRVLTTSLTEASSQLLGVFGEVLAGLERVGLQGAVALPARGAEHNGTARAATRPRRQHPGRTPLAGADEWFCSVTNGTVGEGSITTPQRRILDALAGLGAMGLDEVARSNVAVFSGQSPTSSGFANNLGALRTAGLIDYPSRGRVAITSTGRQLAGAAQPIGSLAELHRAWLGRLSRPQGRLLHALIDVYPASLERTKLAERVGQSSTSSGYANNLGALRSLGVLAYPRPGQVAATPLLFPGLPGVAAAARRQV